MCNLVLSMLPQLPQYQVGTEFGDHIETRMNCVYALGGIKAQPHAQEPKQQRLKCR